jgi:hypothetical protein
VSKEITSVAILGGGLMGAGIAQNLSRHRQQFRDVRRRDRIDHRAALLAGNDDTRPPQHPQLLGQVRRFESHLGQQFPRTLIRAGWPSVLKNSPLSLYNGSDSTDLLKTSAFLDSIS